MHPLGRCTALQEGHFTVLPEGLSTSAPREAIGTQGIGTEELYSALCHPTSWRSRRQGEVAGLPILPGVQGSQKHPPSEACRALHPESGTASGLAPAALPCLTCLGSDICCSRSHGNMQEAGCWQSRPGKPKAALTPSGRGDEAQHQPRLVFSLRGSEPTWEVPS